MITPELFNDYKDQLVAKCFKIIPMIEENLNTLPNYILSLIYELEGLTYLENYRLSTEYISLLGTLNSIYDDVYFDDYDFKRIRSEIFKCIGLVENMNLIDKSFGVGK